MRNLITTMLKSQFIASFKMLGDCIEKCPEDAWDQPVQNYSFRHAAYHALFFADLYLGHSIEEFESQIYHSDNAAIFAGFDELEHDSPQSSHSQALLLGYLQFCREKARRNIDAETPETLANPAGFFWLNCSRAESHVYNIRHIQHHTAHLSLALRRQGEIDIPWAKGDWAELEPPAS